MANQKWSEADYQTLQDLWGEKSIPTIAKRLGRSHNAIKIKAQKLGLGPHIESGTLVSFAQFLRAIGQFHNYSYLKMRLNRDGFPFKKRRVENKRFSMVDIDEFWKWMNKHRDAIDFSNFEENALGKEPDWAKEKRKADCSGSYRFKHTPWTPDEDNTLIYMLDQYKYNFYEISEALGRTEGAIKRRLITLGLKQRPIKKNAKWWTQEEVDILIDLKEKGYDFEYIGQRLKRTGSACRGRYERLQNPDYFLRDNRRAREHFKQFFQKEQCEHWNKRSGCTMKCSGCDDCPEFKRKEASSG